MAELVDALVSGTSARKGVQVRVLFRVHEKSLILVNLVFAGIFCLWEWIGTMI